MSGSPMPNESAAELPPDSVWAALVSEPGTGVAVVDANHKIRYCNKTAARLMVGASPDDLIGRSLYDLLPKEIVDDHLERWRAMNHGNKPVLVRDMWRGQQVMLTIRHTSDPETDADHYLVVIRHVAGDQEAPSSMEMLVSDVIDLGPLDVLTPREIEVLALIGQGLIAKEIASVLGCAPRTVDVHRQSIARKLHVSDRVKLARIALDAGLMLKDAKRTRIPQNDES